MNYYIKKNNGEVSLLGNFKNYDEAISNVSLKGYLWVKPQVALEEMFGDSARFVDKTSMPRECINCSGTNLKVSDVEFQEKYGTFSQIITCNDCAKKWKEMFKFTHIKELN